MATKKSGPTLEQLQSQIAKLQAQAEAIRSKEVQEVIGRIRDAIDHYGLTASDLGFGGTKSASPKRARSAAAEPAKAPNGKEAAPARKTKASAAVKRAPTIKYTDGQGKTWSGVGKRPNWYKDAIAAGKTPEDLLYKETT